MLPLIRPLTAEDYPQWRLLWQEYIAACVEQGIAQPPAECTALNWARLMSDDEPIVALVAEVNDTVVGLVHLIFHLSTFHHGNVCFLQDLYTAKSSRRQGIAQALIAQACTKAAEKGAGRVYWQTAEKNAVAISLYEKLATRAETVNFRINL